MKQSDDLEMYANLSKFLCNKYRQALKILKTEPELKERLSSILKAEKAAPSDGAAFNPAPVSQATQCHAIEQENKDLELVEDLEMKLGIMTRWTSSAPEWIMAKKRIKDHRYLDALSQIERIIVEWLLEMKKIHQSGTGTLLSNL
ncbi:hypothetical protein MSAN_01812800 [Mycena sanguinolenta]|uniref:Uncharacterized protein n=1 Tax=Mycena sanguinolenta TaxID=230812 RepID=A0A8H6XUW9_9AGAR|nr:hypothetical protein MSAN_01812800 [Mycena sanguinolenta]